MLKKIKQGMFPFLIGFSALSVSASAAFYSVSGLSKLFAGASLEVIIMAGSLEFAKLVTASLLYQYWGIINKTLRTYLSIATIILVLITSMGIYGFLSAAYQETYSKLSAIENQKGFIQQKINFYQNDVDRYDTEIERISSNISTLSNAKASSIEVRDTTVSGGIRRTISTTELRMAQSRINIEEENRKLAQEKRTIVSDSLQKFQLQVLELDNNNEIAGELGPLQYLSGLTGISMDKIINWLLLIIIFVFDPLAISLVIAANFAFDKAYPKRKYKENLYGGKVELDEEDYPLPNEALTKAAIEFEVKDAEEIKSLEEFEKTLDKIEKIKKWEAAEKRMEIIGQNGNDGDHYNKLDINKDGIIDKFEQLKAKERIQEIDKIKTNNNLTQEWTKKLELEKNFLKKKLDENIKIY
tara:strand:+ start:675 stop:1913 length:1239 start_codon:yes stop_codon:yes gene_type:complete